MRQIYLKILIGIIVVLWIIYFIQNLNEGFTTMGSSIYRPYIRNMNKKITSIRLFIKTFELAKKRLPSPDEVLSNIEYSVSTELVQRIITEIANDDEQNTAEEGDTGTAGAGAAFRFGEEYV